MPIWKELLKVGKSARGGDDAVSAMFDEIIKVRPDLEGALTTIKNEYRIGNISGEGAKRAANMTERASGVRGSGLDRTGVKAFGDYGASREAARESMSPGAFERIDERIKGYDTEPVSDFERSTRTKEAGIAEDINKDYSSWDKDAIKEFDDALEAIRERELGGSSMENLERGWRREKAGLGNNPVADFENGIKSGLSTQDAIKEIVRNSEDRYGIPYSFENIVRMLRDAYKLN